MAGCEGWPPGPGQVPSPHHELGWALWALMLVLLLCHDRVRRVEGLPHSAAGCFNVFWVCLFDGIL